MRIIKILLIISYFFPLIKDDTGNIQISPGMINYILIPDGFNISGIGIMFHFGLSALELVSVPLSFLLLVSSHFIKDFKNKIAVLIIGSISIIIMGIIYFNNLAFGFYSIIGIYSVTIFLQWKIYKQKNAANIV